MIPLPFAPAVTEARLRRHRSSLWMLASYHYTCTIHHSEWYSWFCQQRGAARFAGVEWECGAGRQPMNFDLLSGAAPLALPVAADVVPVGLPAYPLVMTYLDDHGVRYRGVARPLDPGSHPLATGRHGRPALSVSTAVTDGAGTIWPARTGRAP